MKIPFEYEVESTSRLDLFLQSRADRSRTFIQEQIEKGYVLINGMTAKKPSQKVKAHDRVSGTFVTDEESPLTPVSHSLEILFEDDYLLCLNKSQGMVVHPAIGHRGDTLVHYLLYYLKNHAPFREFPPERPGIVHRLDRGTSGVLLVAKDRKTQDALQKLFKERAIQKIYEALVWGQTQPQMTFQNPIGRDRKNRKKMSSKSDSARASLTQVSIVEKYHHFTHLEVRPKTGRTHQIRVHLSEGGFPIVGDPLYGSSSQTKRGLKLNPMVHDFIHTLDATLLHARSLEFQHPVTKESLKFEAPRPELFDKTLSLLKNFDL